MNPSTSMLLLTAGLVLAAPDGAPRWEQVGQTEGITVSLREVPGYAVKAMRGTGKVDAPIEKVWQVVSDYDTYGRRFSGVVSLTVLQTEQGGKIQYVHQVSELPLASRRDAVFKATDVSEWKDGQGFFKLVLSDPGNVGPKPAKDVVRTKMYGATLLLEPLDGGARTFVTYDFHGDPGGLIPSWMVNMAANGMMTDFFRSLRRLASAPSPKGGN